MAKSNISSNNQNVEHSIPETHGQLEIDAMERNYLEKGLRKYVALHSCMHNMHSSS